MNEANNRLRDLLRTLPALRGAPGVDPFDATKLDRWAAGPCRHGEKCTAQFILSLWSHTDVNNCPWTCGPLTCSRRLPCGATRNALLLRPGRLIPGGRSGNGGAFPMKRTVSVSVSLRPELAANLSRVAEALGKARREVFQEALEAYLLRKLQGKLERTGAPRGVRGEEDVERLVHEYRRRRRA